MEEYKLWGTGWRTAKCELVAAYADVPIVKAPYTAGLSSQTPRMLGLRPDGKVSRSILSSAADAPYCGIAQDVVRVIGTSVGNPSRGSDRKLSYCKVPGLTQHQPTPVPTACEPFRHD